MMTLLTQGILELGHSVTAIYELTMTGMAKSKMGLRYGEEHKSIKGGIKKTNTIFRDEIAFFKLRYKPASGKVSKLITKPLLKSDLITSKPGNNFIFSASVAYFAQRLRESKYAGGVTYDQILNKMVDSKGEDKWGYRKECMSLIKAARIISKE
jgi:Ca-activated chloride channel family protein